MAESSPLLQVNQITKNFQSVGGVNPHEILRGISFDIQAGESMAIVGPSGSGKSTLLNIIGTLDRPTSGQVILEGEDINKKDDQQLAQIRNHEIGFIFQLHHLLPQCTVLENVLVPTLAQKNNGSEAHKQRAMQLIERVGLKDRISHRPGYLSGGERQRVAVVRALINQPKLLLADEPTGSLDQTNAKQLTDLLIELKQEEGIALIMVTHATDLAEKMEKVYRLEGGQLSMQGGHQ